MAFDTEKKFASKKRIATRRLDFATDKRFVDKKRSDRRGLDFSISQASASPDMLGELAALDAFAQPSKKMSACHLKANARSMHYSHECGPRSLKGTGPPGIVRWVPELWSSLASKEQRALGLCGKRAYRDQDCDDDRSFYLADKTDNELLFLSRQTRGLAKSRKTEESTIINNANLSKET